MYLLDGLAQENISLGNLLCNFIKEEVVVLRQEFVLLELSYEFNSILSLHGGNLFILNFKKYINAKKNA